MNILAEDAKHFEGISRHRNEKAYRGMADADWPITTSLQRVNKTAFVQVEKHLLRNFQKYAPQDSVLFNTFWKLAGTGAASWPAYKSARLELFSLDRAPPCSR